MFRKFPLIVIFILAILALITVSYFMFFASDNKFDILEIQQNLTAGNKALFKSDIVWKEEADNTLVGTLQIDALKTKVTYILQNYAITSIILLDKSQESNGNIPCLNIIHLLSKSDIKNVFEKLSKMGNGSIPTEASKVQANSKLFIDYFQTNTKDGLEMTCKMYYLQ
ncbi:MAG: hypothetical protein LBH40_03675 [Alphaproteobacteria bacterium]|jgi:hypothetical protein|nr:hypothetical protein [Alphaproteobacteria bacterium]